MKYCYIKTRKCYICQQIKPRQEFYKDCHDKYGIQGSCKDCQKKRNLKYHYEHKDYFKKKGKEYYKKENNPARYKRYRKAYLKRRKEYAYSVIGRFTTLLYSARCRAKKARIRYNINMKWLLEQYNKQNKRCKLTGIELEFKTNTKKQRQYLPFSPSLHRVNENKGYTQDNTSLVCTGINIARNRFRKKDFIKIILGYLKENAYNEALALLK